MTGEWRRETVTGSSAAAQGALGRPPSAQRALCPAHRCTVWTAGGTYCPRHAEIAPLANSLAEQFGGLVFVPAESTCLMDACERAPHKGPFCPSHRLVAHNVLAGEAPPDGGTATREDLGIDFAGVSEDGLCRLTARIWAAEDSEIPLEDLPTDLAAAWGATAARREDTPSPSDHFESYLPVVKGYVEELLGLEERLASTLAEIAGAWAAAGSPLGWSDLRDADRYVLNGFASRTGLPGDTGEATYARLADGIGKIAAGLVDQA